MSNQGAKVDGADYRAYLIGDENGRMVPKLSNNFYWMLKGHPAMRGVFAWKESAIWIAARPPWGEVGNWTPRVAAKSDYVQTRMWLERQGLRPSLRATIDAAELVAANNS